MDECERILCLIVEENKAEADKALSHLKSDEEYVKKIAGIFEMYLRCYYGVCLDKISRFQLNVKNSEIRTKIHIIKTVLIAQIKLDQGELKEASLSAKELNNFLDFSEICSKFLQKIDNLSEEKKDFDERKSFLKAFNENLEYFEGASWFIVSTSFFSLWKRKVGFLNVEKSSKCMIDQIPVQETCQDLDTIDNTSLVDNATLEELEAKEQIFLLKGKVELHDFILVPAKAYNILLQYYSETHRLERKVIRDKTGKLKIELFYAQVTVVFFKNNKLTEKKHNPSNRSSFRDLCKTVLTHLELKQSDENLSKIVIWKLNKKSTLLEKLTRAKTSSQKLTIEEVLRINQDQLIDEVIIENFDYFFIDFSLNQEHVNISPPKQKKCFNCEEKSLLSKCKCSKIFCENCLKKHKKECPDCKEKQSKSFFSIFNCFCRSKSSKLSKKKSKLKEKASETIQSLSSTATFSLTSLKVTGLRNLGNTCYMNSALQCIIHCEPLSQYFLDLKPLSSPYKKPLIRAYIQLLHEMCGRQESVAPGDFKRIISKQNRYFEGFQQHDSQEFLTFFISFLHDELNEKSSKHLSKNLNSPKESSEESWQRFKNENKSIISDLFYGQFKSTVTCLACSHDSTIFETFNCLSLPVPLLQQDVIEIRFVPLALDHELRLLSFQYESGKTFFDIRAEASKVLDLPLESLKIFEIRENFPLLEVKYHERYVRGNSRVIFEVPKNDGYLGFFYIQMHQSRSYLRAFSVGLDDTFETILQNLETIMKPLVGEISETETFLEFSPVRNNFIDCFVCSSSSCPGCKIEPSGKPIVRFLRMKKKIFVKVEIMKAKKNCTFDDKLVSFKKAQNNQSCVTLSDCFQAFSHPETLEKAEAWVCSKCKTKGKAQKTIELNILPHILVIHLKRFRINRQTREKITAKIKFPKNDLKLDEFALGYSGSSYDLFAICNHMGSLHGGHYTANVYNKRSSRWFECNDSQISDSETLSESSSYMLFYSSRDNLKS